MVKASYRLPNHRVEEYLPSGGREFFAKLLRAKVEPEKHSMPICYKHIEDLAQSIRRRELTNSVLVLVEPGLADPDYISANMFCCFLCQRDET